MNCYICDTPNATRHPGSYEFASIQSPTELAVLCGDCHDRLHAGPNSWTYVGQKTWPKRHTHHRIAGEMVPGVIRA